MHREEGEAYQLAVNVALSEFSHQIFVKGMPTLIPPSDERLTRVFQERLRSILAVSLTALPDRECLSDSSTQTPTAVGACTNALLLTSLSSCQTERTSHGGDSHGVGMPSTPAKIGGSGVGEGSKGS